MITDTGWQEYCIWEHSAIVADLYARRARQQAEEMTCAAQAAELLKPLVTSGDTLLDVGCGSGYFFHSLRARGIEADYTGIDAAPSLIKIGREIMPEFGLPEEKLRVMRIEDLSGSVDHVVCMNVLANVDDYRRPLERLLKVARKSVILRESVIEGPGFTSYVKDHYLDPEVDLKVYVNAYPLSGWLAFIDSHDFDARVIMDERTRGEPELVIDHPHHWKFFVATRRQPL